MISRDTVLRAHQWYQAGVSWVEKDAANMGLTYLERAISVFEEAGDKKRLTHALHQRLVAMYKLRQDEEVESHYEEVMQGYLELDDGYGQALLLSLVAQAVARQGRWERALVHLNLAVTLAQAQGNQRLLSFLLTHQASLLVERDDVQPAVRLLKQAEEAATKVGDEVEVARLRALQGVALTRMGEQAQAIALLEDAQTRYLRLDRHREALDPLKLLQQLYDSGGMWEDKSRVDERIHFSGQRLVQRQDQRKPPPFATLPVDVELEEETLR